MAPAAPPLRHALRYRPDVDGLRAVAVLAVVGYHLHASWFPGGFVGVDIFFVISGFLISKLIVEEVEATGGFSFRNFYKRRLSRLFPALYVVVLACFAASAWLAPPEMFASFAESALATLLSVSNFVFWQQSGYFAPQNLAKPLLHTWSLAVEEQFYLLWPLLLFACRRWHRNAPWIALALLAAASLGAAVVRQDDGALIYYLLPFRLFELAIGGLLVWAERAWPARRFATALALAGVALMLYPVFAYSDDTLFPSYNALMPCLGAALLIHAGARSALVQALLANRAVVGIGLLSYSLYLVHWPLLVFFRLTPMGMAGQRSLLLELGLFLAMLALAALLYRFVEQPLRRAGARASFARVALVALAATVLLAVPAAHAWRTGGWPWRFRPELARLMDPVEATRGVPHFDMDCFLLPWKQPGDIAPSCYQAPHNGKPNLLLLGDSAVFHYAHGLADRLRGQANVLAWTNSACPILPGYGNAKNPRCAENSRYFYEEILPRNRYDIVLVAVKEDRAGLQSHLPAAVAALERTGARVVLIGQTPIFIDAFPRLVALHGKVDGLGPYLRLHLKEGCRGELGLDALVPKGRFFSVNAVLCEPGSLRFEDEQGAPLFVDHVHLGTRGSAYMADRLIPFLDANLGTRFRAGAAAAAPAPSPDAASAQKVLADLRALQAALAAYRREHGAYPRSQGFDGLRTNWGRASANWIEGLAPRYIAQLPSAPGASEGPAHQYLYRSNGSDYKLLAHGTCQPLAGAHPELVDPRRDCFAVGVWTPGARDW